MAKNIGIVFSATDNFSTTVIKMAQVNAAFNKDLQGLQDKLNVLNKSKTTVNVDIKNAKKELKELEKAFSESADEKIGKQIEERTAELEKMTQNANFLKTAVKGVQREMEKLDAEQSKSENKASKGSAMIGKVDSWLNTIPGSQFVSMAIDTASNMFLTHMSSAYGEDTGIYASGILMVRVWNLAEKPSFAQGSL